MGKSYNFSSDENGSLKIDEDDIQFAPLNKNNDCVVEGGLNLIESLLDGDTRVVVDNNKRLVFNLSDDTHIVFDQNDDCLEIYQETLSDDVKTERDDENDDLSIEQNDSGGVEKINFTDTENPNPWR